MSKPKVGDKVMWDDDEEGFTGIYEITAIRGKKKDDIWLYSAELGNEAGLVGVADLARV
jgi:hypothetical protein